MGGWVNDYFSNSYIKSRRAAFSFLRYHRFKNRFAVRGFVPCAATFLIENRRLPLPPPKEGELKIMNTISIHILRHRKPSFPCHPERSRGISPPVIEPAKQPASLPSLRGTKQSTPLPVIASAAKQSTIFKIVNLK